MRVNLHLTTRMHFSPFLSGLEMIVQAQKKSRPSPHARRGRAACCLALSAGFSI